MDKKEKESFHVSEETIDDFTSKGNWEIEGEIYNFIEDYPSRDCDGECHNVVVQRESDNKYFQFDWFYSGGDYHYESHWVEVFRKEVVTITWE